MVTPNRLRYLASLSDELMCQSNRMRDLIGNAHWVSDGHHKEYVLVELLNRHLPTGFMASRGFVVSPVQDDICSTEQDILIVDTTVEPPLFNQSGMIVVFPTMVVASISVKTQMGQDEIVESIAGLASVVDVCRSRLDDTRLWCGAFFYENAFVNGDTAAAHFRRGISESILVTPGVRSFFASSPGTVLLAETNHSDVTSPRLAGYNCGDLAAAFLLADLIEHLAECRGGDSMFSIVAELSGPGVADDTEFPQLNFGSE